MFFRTLSPMSLAPTSLGVVLKLASTLFFTLMSVCLKLLGDAYPVAQLVFSRAFFALIPIVMWLGWRGDLLSSFKTNRLVGHVVRAQIGIAAMFCTFAALTLLPLADVTALSYASPLMTVVLAALLLGEKVMIWRWSAVIVGFLGVLLMLWPHLSGGTRLLDLAEANGPFLALAGALLAAMGIIQMRRLTTTEASGTIVLYFTLTSGFISLLCLPLGWVWPSWSDLILMVMAGVLGGLAQICITESYRRTAASFIAPFQYTSMIWSVVFGVLIFAEPLEPLVMFGAVVVIAAGLFVLYRERRLGLLASRPGEPPRSDVV